MSCPDPTGRRSRMKPPARVLYPHGPGGPWVASGGCGWIGSLGRGLGDALAIIKVQSALISVFLK